MTQKNDDLKDNQLYQKFKIFQEAMNELKDAIIEETNKLYDKMDELDKLQEKDAGENNTSEIDESAGYI